MNREKLIQKWLDHELNTQELEAFKQLEDYESLTKLSDRLKYFKANDYNTEAELEGILSTIKTSKTQKVSWIKTVMRVAAILVVGFGLYFYTTTLDTTVSTLAMEKIEINLPDASKVLLNAKSTLIYNKSKWKDLRNVTLNGEAFFKVAKGSKFSVNTTQGIVTVLGTQFNIKHRNNYFEVICYEGSVGVTLNTQETTLKAGDSFLIIDGKLIAKEKENQLSPSWLNNESNFSSIPFREVVAELERQYNISIELKNIDKNILFTGSFAHDNLDIALQSITLPLHLSYSKTNGIITIIRE